MLHGQENNSDGFIKRQTASVLRFLNRHPLWGYFLLVFGLIWLWEFPIYGLMDYWRVSALFVTIVSPSVIGLIMAGITEGNIGISRLLESCTRWRIGIIWYLLALLPAPILLFITAFSMPEVAGAFRMPSLSFAWSYLSGLFLAFLGAPLVEEFGWRGFALPRLQKQHGPLLGTLILGSLWALWHLPSWFLTGRVVIGSSAFETLAFFLKYAGSIFGSAFIYTWLYNRSNRSLFLPMLFHASINQTFSLFPGSFFPSLFRLDTPSQLFSQIGFIPLALVVIIVTRGRLGYDQDQQANSA